MGTVVLLMFFSWRGCAVCLKFRQLAWNEYNSAVLSNRPH